MYFIVHAARYFTICDGYHLVTKNQVNHLILLVNKLEEEDNYVHSFLYRSDIAEGITQIYREKHEGTMEGVSKDS